MLDSRQATTFSQWNHLRRSLCKAGTAFPGSGLHTHSVTTYGQRGGDGPNTGKKASVYQGTLPDGTVVKKRSFNFHEDSAFLYIFKFEGKWVSTGVFPDKSVLTENSDSYYIVAKKIS